MAVLCTVSDVFASQEERWRQEHGLDFQFALPCGIATLRALVEYVYTGRCTIEEALLGELVMVADFLGLRTELELPIRIEAALPAPEPSAGPGGMRLAVAVVGGSPLLQQAEATAHAMRQEAERRTLK